MSQSHFHWLCVWRIGLGHGHVRLIFQKETLNLLNINIYKLMLKDMPNETSDWSGGKRKSSHTKRSSQPSNEINLTRYRLVTNLSQMTWIALIWGLQRLSCLSYKRILETPCSLLFPCFHVGRMGDILVNNSLSSKRWSVGNQWLGRFLDIIGWDLAFASLTGYMLKSLGFPLLN